MCPSAALRAQAAELLLRLQWHGLVTEFVLVCLRLAGITASENKQRLAVMSRAAASLELNIEVVTDPDAVDASQQAVDALRKAVEDCTGLKSSEPLLSTVERIVAFVSGCCAEQLPELSEESEPVWQLMQTSIACGLELLGIGYVEETANSEIWSNPLIILAETLDSLKAQLKLITFADPTTAAIIIQTECKSS